ncbi:nucleoside phosphatase family-domain-containing protein [Fimicolochytrium jonesii]|uniref:nucleoside phosphatase family-domain-containing protein n=1 Tax=Fimicolochytrium jonesii TaxID=1396493 RepID=UPI0022FEB739|nr:nucleoside phosphatase family-domain-containing protein [Fimicolochytrium jonesii]KAI8825112.1 nucleoside phosphatase family-domain-containing protein [Fimicolochytrium jonesii]
MVFTSQGDGQPHSRSRHSHDYTALPHHSKHRDGSSKFLKRPPRVCGLSVPRAFLCGVLFSIGGYLILQAFVKGGGLHNISSSFSKASSALNGCPNPEPDRPPIQYALVMDAGSTGSRLHVYRFNHCHGPSPALEDEVFEQLKPGLSSDKFKTPEEAANSLDPLLEVALKSVPERLRACTPVTLKATAGLRMLKDGKGDMILDAVRRKLEKESPFALVENGVTIMAGKDEGVYAWITVNYLLKRLGQKEKLPTAAIMDLGGGSTQIVFEPDAKTPMEPGDHKYELKMGPHKYILYQHSYDGYGLMQGRHRVKQAGVASKKWPCYAIGHKDEYLDDAGTIHTIEGSGTDHDACAAFIRTKLFDKATCPAPKTSTSPPSCSFNGVYQPSLAASFADNDIYAFSYFFDKFAEPFGLETSEKGFSVGELRAAAEKVCSGKLTPQDLAKLTADGTLPKQIVELFSDPEWCTDLGFMYGLLSVGYDIPDQRILKTAKKINGVETGWALGAALDVVDGWGTKNGKGKCAAPAVKEITR